MKIPKPIIIVGAAVAVILLILVAFSGKTNDRSPQNAPAKPQIKQVVSNLAAYNNKTVTVSGQLVKLNNDYYLVNQAKKAGQAIKLDFSHSKLNPASLSTAPTAQSMESTHKAAATYVVTGQVTQKDGTAPALVVQEIKAK